MRIRGYETQLERVLPEETCPVCGKRFLRRCRKMEWGYYWHGPKEEHILLCSGECSKKYAAERLEQSAREVAKTRIYKAYRLWKGGMQRRDAAEAYGLSVGGFTSNIEALEARHWKELELLEKRGGTV